MTGITLLKSSFAKNELGHGNHKFNSSTIKNKSWAKFSSVLLVLVFFQISNAQAGKDEASYYIWFDKITGLENSGLHYGIVYNEKHRTKNKKYKFLNSPDFLSGSVIFEGQPYFGLDLKYNVYEDEVLMRVQNRFGGNTLQLYKNKLEGFSLDGYKFIKIDLSIDNAAVDSGYYEVSMENSIYSLLKKHRKQLKLRLGVKSVYYEFEEDLNEYVLFYQNEYYAIENANDLKRIFPQQAEQLSSFYKNQKMESNANFDTNINSILVYLETLMSAEHQTIQEK